MGVSGCVQEDVEEVTDTEGPKKTRNTLWKRIWMGPDKDPIRVLGLPLRWFAAACLATVVAIILCTVLGVVLPARKEHFPPVTGNYTADAPFREVLRSNFPDPSLLRQNNTWYAYATNNAAGILESKLNGQVHDLGAANVQLATSSDFLNWTLHGQADDPLAKLGEWVSKKKMRAESDSSVVVRKANVWAPEALKRADGKFVLYYAAEAANHSVHCVGAAVGDTPTGPFEPQDKPIACPVDLGGAIDPASLVDSDGTVYLAYKIDGNAMGNGGECGNTVDPLKDTPILLQKMEQDGTTPSGSPITILDRTEDDGPLVEAAAIVRSEEGVYFLFFSSGCTRNPSYDIKYATSSNIAGPYKRAAEPLLQTESYGLLAPGSASISRDNGTIRMAFHARVYTDIGGIRAMYVSDVKLSGTNATLEAPT